jgi:hypothetical protein
MAGILAFRKHSAVSTQHSAREAGKWQLAIGQAKKIAFEVRQNAAEPTFQSREKFTAAQLSFWPLANCHLLSHR